MYSHAAALTRTLLLLLAPALTELTLRTPTTREIFDCGNERASPHVVLHQKVSKFLHQGLAAPGWKGLPGGLLGIRGGSPLNGIFFEQRVEKGKETERGRNRAWCSGVALQTEQILRAEPESDSLFPSLRGGRPTDKTPAKKVLGQDKIASVADGKPTEKDKNNQKLKSILAGDDDAESLLSWGKTPDRKRRGVQLLGEEEDEEEEGKEERLSDMDDDELDEYITKGVDKDPDDVSIGVDEEDRDKEPDVTGISKIVSSLTKVEEAEAESRRYQMQQEEERKRQEREHLEVRIAYLSFQREICDLVEAAQADVSQQRAEGTWCSRRSENGRRRSTRRCFMYFCPPF